MRPTCSPARRPGDGRYGLNPNRLQHYYQYQVIVKPSPENGAGAAAGQLRAPSGWTRLKHDFRFVEDDWESPTLGAWGLGWEVWCDGMEVGQFTLLPAGRRHSGGAVPSFEMTYGLERLAMYVQDVERVYDLDFNGGRASPTATCSTCVPKSEYSAYNFEHADTAMLARHFADAERECASLAWPAALPLPAYDQCIKASRTCSTCWTPAG